MKADTFFKRLLDKKVLAVSRTGRVRNKQTGREIGYVDSSGYKVITFQDSRKRIRKIGVHRLMCLRYMEVPKKRWVVNHKDGDKLHNELGNFELTTNQGNMIHARDVLKSMSYARLDMKVANRIRRLYATGNYTQRDLGEHFGVHQTHVSDIVNSRRWIE